MRLCSGPGCQRAIPEGQRFCDACKAERGIALQDNAKVHTSGYTEELDAQRKSGRWQRTREKALTRCPMCARCNVRLSEICDHIVPAGVAVQQARDSGRYPYDRWAGYYLLKQPAGVVISVPSPQDHRGQDACWPVAKCCGNRGRRA